MAIVTEDSIQLLNKRLDISNQCVKKRWFFLKWHLGAFSPFISLSHEHTLSLHIYTIIVYPKLIHNLYLFL